MIGSRLAPVILVGILFILTIGSPTTAEYVVIDRFLEDVQEATLEFNETLTNTSLAFDIPRGANVVSAQVSVEGVGGVNLSSKVLDFNGGVIGKDVWAHWKEGQGLHPPKVDPVSHTWQAATNNEVLQITKEDNNGWELHTTDQGQPPYSWPIQLFRFKPNILAAKNITISWNGIGYCGSNQTAVYQSEMWLYNFTDKVWWRAEVYRSMIKNDPWLNHTIEIPSTLVAGNGTIAVAIAGPHSESIAGNVDDGQIHTDYISVDVISMGEVEYPKNVTLTIDNAEVATLPGSIIEPQTIGEAHAFAATLQGVIDSYQVMPGNVTLWFNFSVGTPTVGKLYVRDLLIEYEPVVNTPPSYEGPTTVEVEEDADWTPIVDLDDAFTDDHNKGDLDFELMTIIFIPENPPPVNFRMGTGPGGNRTLEVRPVSDFFGDFWFPYYVEATDLFGSSAKGYINITILQKPDRPRIYDPGTLQAREMTPFSYMIYVTDVDLTDDFFTFEDDSEYLDINSTTGEINWTPGPDQIGIHSFLVTVTDRFGLSDTISISINVENSNDPPQIYSNLLMNGKQGIEASYSIRANDPDVPYGDVLHYFAFSDAIDLSLEPSTGRITFKPTNDHVPAINITLLVTDLTGESDEAILHVLVENVNDPPSFAEYHELTCDQNENVSLQLSALDPDLGLDLQEPEILTFTGQGTSELLPDTAGLIEFFAGQSLVGAHEMTYIVTDNEGLQDIITVTWVINDVNDNPVITTKLDEIVAVNEDEEFTIDLDATDADGDDLVWSDNTELFDIGPTSGVVSFVPTQAEVGTHTVRIIVSDGEGGGAVAVFVLEVRNVNDDPIIVSVEPEDGTEFKKGKVIVLSASATDEDGDSLTVTWMDGNEVLGTGSPLEIKLGKGEHTITVVVDDGTDRTEQSLTIIVKEDKESPNIGIVASLMAIGMAGIVAWRKLATVVSR